MRPPRLHSGEHHIRHATVDAIDILQNEIANLRSTGGYRRALTLLTLLFERLQKRGAQWDLAWCACTMGIIHRHLGRYDGSLFWFDFAKKRAAANSDVVCEIWAEAELAEVRRIRGQKVEALGDLLEVSDAFEEQKHTPGVVWSLNAIGQIYLKTGRLSEALQVFRKSVRVNERRDDKHGLGWSRRGEAEVLFAMRKPDEANESALSALRHFRSARYRVGVGYSLKTLATIALASEDYNRSVKLVDEAMAEFEKSEQRGLGFMHNVRADLLLRGGRIPDAIDSVVMSERIAKEIGVEAIREARSQEVKYLIRSPLAQVRLQ